MPQLAQGLWAPTSSPGLWLPGSSAMLLPLARQEGTRCSAESWTSARAQVQTEPIKWPFPPSFALPALLVALILFIMPRKTELRLSHSAGFSGDYCLGSWNVHSIIFASPWEGFLFFIPCPSVSPSGLRRKVCETQGVWCCLWLSNALPLLV